MSPLKEKSGFPGKNESAKELNRSMADDRKQSTELASSTMIALLSHVLIAS